MTKIGNFSDLFEYLKLVFINSVHDYNKQKQKPNDEIEEEENDRIPL